MDAAISHLQVTTGVFFDVRGNPLNKTFYSYYIDGHGPFKDEFLPGADTPEAVNAAMQARVDHLRAVGALKPPALSY